MHRGVESGGLKRINVDEAGRILGVVWGGFGVFFVVLRGRAAR